MPTELTKSQLTYLRDKDKILARNAAWAARNRESRLAYFKEYNQRPERQAASKAHRLVNREKYVRLRRERRGMEKEKWRAYYKEYRKNRPTLYKDYYKKIKPQKNAQFCEWYKKNKSKRAEYHRQYRVENCHRLKSIAHKRRALKRKATINLRGIRQFIQSVKRKEMTTCYYCKIVFPSNKCHFDHIVPLSKGGPHCVENLCVACPSCNLSKSSKPLRVWIKTGQQLLEI